MWMHRITLYDGGNWRQTRHRGIERGMLCAYPLYPTLPTPHNSECIQITPFHIVRFCHQPTEFSTAKLPVISVRFLFLKLLKSNTQNKKMELFQTVIIEDFLKNPENNFHTSTNTIYYITKL